VDGLALARLAFVVVGANAYKRMWPLA